MQFSRTVLSSETENASEASFQTPKPDHANAPIRRLSACIHAPHRKDKVRYGLTSFSLCLIMQGTPRPRPSTPYTKVNHHFTIAVLK